MLCKTGGQRLDGVSIQLHGVGWVWVWGVGPGGPAVLHVKDEEGRRKLPRWEPAEAKRVSDMVMLTTLSSDPMAREEGCENKRLVEGKVKEFLQFCPQHHLQTEAAPSG